MCVLRVRWFNRSALDIGFILIAFVLICYLSHYENNDQVNKD